MVMEEALPPPSTLHDYGDEEEESSTEDPFGPIVVLGKGKYFHFIKLFISFVFETKF